LEPLLKKKFYDVFKKLFCIRKKMRIAEIITITQLLQKLEENRERATKEKFKQLKIT
jgi:hypothetical protein